MTFLLAVLLLQEKVDVLVYGATPAGIAASIAAAKGGRDVLLVEPTGRVGGMVTNGLSHADFRTFEGLTGAFLDFTRRVQARYGKPEASFRGTHAEPVINLAVFEDMLAEHPRVRVKRRHVLGGVLRSGPRIVSASFGTSSVEAAIFIDATYEGDLLAAAGVPFRVGREARSEYAESLAPDIADRQLQGYNFRLVMTKEPANRVAPIAPPGYRREDFLDVLPLFASGRLKTVFGTTPTAIYKAQMPPLPNGKYDVNDMSHGPVRLSIPPANAAWPEPEARKAIYAEHLRHDTGLLYFLQTDAAVPERIRDEARAWGWCADEFTENGHLPEQLYVREARRMVGMRVFTERDTDPAPGDARAVFQPDAIAMGDYGPNCHGTAHEGPLFGGKHTGEFYKPVAPYQVPYGVIVPKEVENLLVPVACSASHVGFCALRLEPIWTSLGQAAGWAAHLSILDGLPVQKLSPAKIQARLHADGAATAYVSDVLPGAPEFAAVQRWAAAGGLHGLHPPLAKPGQRGAHLTGQYFEAFSGHAAELDRPVEDSQLKRWAELARSLGGKSEGAVTRRDFILGR